MIVRIFENNNTNMCVVYIDGMVNKDLLGRDVIKPLENMNPNLNLKDIIGVSHLKTIDINLGFVQEVLDGNVAIISQGSEVIYITDLKDWEKRAVETPDSESVVRGPKESFTETLRVNTSMIRRKIKNNKLVIEHLTLGEQTNTSIALCYIDDIVNKKVLKSLKNKLNNIKADSILETGYIEQYIEDRPLLSLPTVGSTQKPDVAAAKILEGRIVIICDGTPHVATIPHLFIEHLQTSEDYYHRPFLATFLRLIRMGGLMISVLLPGAYVAVATYHPEMIPTQLLETIASSTTVIPFPKGAECFIMLFIFEILRESGTRLPKNIGSAVSIMGAIVIGQAAIDAGIVGSPMVIIIALTALSSFIIPSLMEFMTVYRFIFLLLGSTMGLVGICSGVMIVLGQIMSMESFGVDYSSIKSSGKKVRDFIIRYPLSMMKYRPAHVAKNNIKRQGV